MSETRRPHFPSVFVLLSAVMTMVATPLMARAQSSYAMSTLSAPVGGQVAAGVSTDVTRHFGIDNANNVIGPAYYANGWYWDSNAPHLRKRFDPYVVRWLASTASAVAPTKLLKAPNWTYMDLDVSAGNAKVLVYSDGQSVFDVATGKLVAKMPVTLDGKVINNGGTVLWQSKDGSGITGTWSAAAGTSNLPAATNAGIGATWVNNAGVVAGVAVLPNDLLPRAATWANGQLTVLDRRPGVGSRAMMINDAGQILIASLSRLCTSVCVNLTDSQGVLDNGIYTPIAGPGGPVRGQIFSEHMNNKGDVVGCMNPNSTGTIADCRGFLWKAQTLYDVTTWLPTKGVTLPAGSYIRHVFAINDSGSMLAELVSAKGVASVVRLTARP